MTMYLRLAWRNIWRHRRRTIIVVLAMGLGMALLVFYDGLLVGFQEAIYGNAIKVLGGNIQVHAAGYGEKADQMPLLPLANNEAPIQAALAQPNVVTATSRINTSGMASNREGSFPVNITGLDPGREAPVSLIAQHITAGRNLAADDQDLILIGRGLAKAMDVEVGDRITLVGRSAHEQMRRRTMTVVGVFDIGLPAFEKRTVYISLYEAQDLYNLHGQATEVIIILKQIGQEAPVAAALNRALTGYEIDTWEDSFPELRQALGMKNAVMGIFGLIILSIAGIGILNVMLMAVYERTREIGLLGAMGLKPRQILALFLAEGVMLGLVGALTGTVLGLLINGILSRVGIDYSQFANLTEYMALMSGRVYSTIVPGLMLKRALTVIVIATLAALLPAREAARREAAEALHYV